MDVVCRSTGPRIRPLHVGRRRHYRRYHRKTACHPLGGPPRSAKLLRRSVDSGASRRLRYWPANRDRARCAPASFGSLEKLLDPPHPALTNFDWGDRDELPVGKNRGGIVDGEQVNLLVAFLCPEKSSARRYTALIAVIISRQNVRQPLTDQLPGSLTARLSRQQGSGIYLHPCTESSPVADRLDRTRTVSLGVGH